LRAFEHGKEIRLTYSWQSKKGLSNKKCPRCGQPGSGPYSRWVRNSQGKRYEPYLYFAHREGSRVRWCYLGKAKLDNKGGAQLSNKTEQLEAP
jgi:hypothetical protein